MATRRPITQPHVSRRPAARGSNTHTLKLLLIALGLLVVGYLSLWLMLVQPQYYIPPPILRCSDLVVSLRYPHYIAVGGESFVEVGLLNTGPKPISGTAVVAFGGDLYVHPIPSKTNYISFTALPPSGIMADQVRFTLNEPPTRLRGTLPFTVQITADQPCTWSLVGSPLRLAPLLGLMATLSSLLSVTSFVLLRAPTKGLFDLLWEQIKKRLFPEKK